MKKYATNVYVNRINDLIGNMDIDMLNQLTIIVSEIYQDGYDSGWDVGYHEKEMEYDESIDEDPKDYYKQIH